MYLVHELDQNSSLVYVVSGSLSVSQKSLDRTDRNSHLFVAVRGELVGTLAGKLHHCTALHCTANLQNRHFSVNRGAEHVQYPCQSNLQSTFNKQVR